MNYDKYVFVDAILNYQIISQSPGLDQPSTITILEYMMVEMMVVKNQYISGHQFGEGWSKCFHQYIFNLGTDAILQTRRMQLVISNAHNINCLFNVFTNAYNISSILLLQID